jgi:hypothetical protein
VLRGAWQHGNRRPALLRLLLQLQEKLIMNAVQSHQQQSKQQNQQQQQ